MELGQKIKQARLAAGLSQRQLCGDRLTRNMLSQIENGSAGPSMKTLEYLAARLEKPISYFLEEEGVTLPNREPMEQARQALALGDWDGLRKALDAFRHPEEILEEERLLLEFLWRLNRGQQALTGGQKPYGVRLLREALEMDGLYLTRLLRQRCRVLLALAGEPEPVECDTDTILARALAAPEPARRLEILASADPVPDSRLDRLRGEALLALGEYGQAEEAILRLPRTAETLQWLEICRREQGDYRGAYEYAVLLRNNGTLP